MGERENHISDDAIGLWALMQRIERCRHRAELAEQRAAAASDDARSEMLEIADQWRALAVEIEALERPRHEVGAKPSDVGPSSALTTRVGIDGDLGWNRRKPLLASPRQVG